MKSKCDGYIFLPSENVTRAKVVFQSLSAWATNALAAINTVYPVVNVLTGIALIFATGGSAVAALHIGGNRKDAASCSFSVSVTASILCWAAWCPFAFF